MKKLLFICVCMLLLVKFAGAQEQLSLRQQADNLYDRYEYFKSLSFYLKLVKRNASVQILERIADCYRNINKYEDAEAFYARATDDAKASKISHYYYAEVLLRNQKFELAKQQYQLYFNNDPARLALKLADCDSAVSWMKQTSAHKIKNETALNTAYSDWGLSYEGKTGMIFTSDRLTDNGDGDNRTGNNWFKLFEKAANSDEITPLTIATTDNSIFTDDYHIGPMALNAAGDTAYLTITTGATKKQLPIDKRETKMSQRLYSRRLQLVVAAKKDGQWVVFGSFPYNDIQQYSVGNAALSKDGRVIYFTSDMPGGEGKTDIWYCEKQTSGAWGKPINCGKTINTPEEEDFPTIGGDGALYYSSKGLPGMGGFDIYKAKGQKAQWSVPENLEYPVNSTSDDFYLMTRDGVKGYLSSDREGGSGNDDIYSFAPNPVHIIPAKPARPHVDTPRLSTVKPPVKTTQAFALVTIYYDLDKSNIRPDAARKLDQMILFLKEYPTVKIELSSYTDSRASDSYNMALSQRRAASAMAYLVNKGIAATRLVVKYYGETHLVNGCGDNVPCTEAEHQLNRRTEFRMIGNGE